MLIGRHHGCGPAPSAFTQVVNKPDNHGGSLDWTKICEKSSKVITFIDLAGHEKYLKTTVFGMTGHLPDFCMLMVRGGGENADAPSLFFFQTSDARVVSLLPGGQ